MSEGVFSLSKQTNASNNQAEANRRAERRDPWRRRLGARPRHENRDGSLGMHLEISAILEKRRAAALWRWSRFFFSTRPPRPCGVDHAPLSKEKEISFELFKQF
jgi:hypothetical protein